ncbi:hypothetical protein [Escherichia coli]|uniref:hypothetical protein n=1 Tax=Escherichia coli TaxID=562 RepID=UPI000AC80702
MVIPGLDSNLLDNAFEASLRSDEGNKIVELFLSDEGDDVVIEVADDRAFSGRKHRRPLCQTASL